MNVLVFGGRMWGVEPSGWRSEPPTKAEIERRSDERNALYEMLTDIHGDGPIECIVNGGAPGADSIGRKWAEDVGVEVRTYEADWDSYGKSAGPRRNQDMLDNERIDLAIEAPGGRGTLDMRTRLSRAGIDIKTVEIEP